MRIEIMVLVLLALSGPAHGWNWLNEPLPELQQEAPQVAQTGACIEAILSAEQRYNIPDNLLLALGLQEAGYRSPEGLTVWPWAVNAAGEGRHFASRAQAENFVAQKLAAGVTSIDVGCLQINLRWHPEAFSSYSQGFDARVNADYAARFLLELYEESGDWWQAAGHYHSRSAGPKATYLASLARNQRVAQTRFSEFAALGDGYSPKPMREPVPYRTEGAIWGADLAGEEGGSRSLYSAHDIEPVLPNFLPPEI